MSSSKKQENLRFRWQPRAGNPHFALIQYLRQNWEHPKEGIIEALDAFWLPIACQQSRQFSLEQIKRMGQKSIEALHAQINWICEELDLENPYDLEEQLRAAFAHFDGQFIPQESEKEPDEPDYPNSMF